MTRRAQIGSRCSTRFITILGFLGVIGGCADSNPVRSTPTLSPTSPPTSPSSDLVTPSISSISPTSAVAGSPDFTLKVTGTNFLRQSGPVGSWVMWSGTDLSTTVLSTTELTAVVHAALLDHSGTVRVHVENGDIMGISDGYLGYPKSNVVVFDVIAQVTDVVIGAYSATLAASPSCASALPLTARERTYTVTLLPGRRLEWTGPTLKFPPVSSGTVSGDAFIFSIDIERDPQDDDFRGISDDMGGGTYLNIWGKGSGTADHGGITGLLSGVFVFYEPNISRIGRYCVALDHRFTMVKVQ